MHDSFDVQSATTLFWNPVPTVLRMQDREEQVVELMVRILSGVCRTNHNSRVRRTLCSPYVFIPSPQRRKYHQGAQATHLHLLSHLQHTRL